MDGSRNHVLVIDIDDEFLIAIERLLGESGIQNNHYVGPEGSNRTAIFPIIRGRAGGAPPTRTSCFRSSEACAGRARESSLAGPAANSAHFF